VIRTSLDKRDYAPTFPVYQDYLTSKHSQLTYCRSNASQPDHATPVLELTLVVNTFGYKTSNQLSEKETFNLREATVSSRKVGSMRKITIR